MKLKSVNGLTLVELLIAIFVLSVGILSVLLFFTHAMRSTEYARDLVVATSHGEYMFEEMRTRSSLANIVATDWSAWAASEGLTTLSAESVSAVIANAASDPLHIDATVNWTRNNRDYDVSLTTEITK